MITQVVKYGAGIHEVHNFQAVYQSFKNCLSFCLAATKNWKVTFCTKCRSY